MAPARSFTALLAVAAIPAAAGIALRSQENQCECMNWKEVTNEDAPCGTGPEKNTFFWCKDFYQKFNDNSCLNLNVGEDRGQWCYVSNDCQSLNGGEKVNGGVNWKKCQGGSDWGDKMTRNLDPTALVSLTDKSGLLINTMVKLAYPTHSGALWKEVSPFFGVGPDGLKRLPVGFQACGAMGKCTTLLAVQNELLPRWGTKGGMRSKFDAMKMPSATKKQMRKIVESGVPVIFDSADTKDPPFVIVTGKKLTLIWGKDATPMGQANLMM